MQSKRARCLGLQSAIIHAQGGAQAQQAALVGALVKNMYNADASNQPWAELTARYLFR